MYELQVKELVFSVNYAVWIFGGMQLFLLPLTFFHIIFSLQYQITFCWQMRLDFHLQSNICSILYRGPFRVGVHMSLVWILKPFIHVLRRKPCPCRYFAIVFALVSVAVPVSIHLCHLSPFHLSYVAVSRPCRLSEFTLIGPLYQGYLGHHTMLFPTIYNGMAVKVRCPS